MGLAPHWCHTWEAMAVEMQVESPEAARKKTAPGPRLPANDRCVVATPGAKSN